MAQSLTIPLLAVLLTIVASSLSLSAQNRTDTQIPAVAALPTVVVVGAGVAGLTAAATLHATGKFNVILLEAMSRIGGRTHTLRFDSGHHIEMGAEWVHGEKGNAIFELVSPLGLVQRYADPPFRPDQHVIQSGVELNETMVQLIWEIYGHIEENPEGWGAETREASFGEYARKVLEVYLENEGVSLSSRLQEVVLDAVHRMFMALDSADNWFDVSAGDGTEDYQNLEGFHNVTWRPPYAYSSLHQLILTGNVTESGQFTLPDYIRLGKEVIQIDYSVAASEVERGERAVVVAKGEPIHYADHVIVTTSLGVLKANHDLLFKPKLPSLKQRTIENLGFGTATKYYLQFSEPWWPADFDSVTPLWDDIEYDYSDPRWMYWRSNITVKELQADLGGFPLWVRGISRIFTIDSRSHPHMLRAWISGPASRYMDTWNPAYIRTHVMAVVRRFMGSVAAAAGKTMTEPVDVQQSKWWTNQFTRGVYSFRSLDSDRSHVWARDLAEPILGPGNGIKPIVCFAGEATHPIFYSTVHGAYESGLREAKRIIEWQSMQGSGTHLTAKFGFLSLTAIYSLVTVLN